MKSIILSVLLLILSFGLSAQDSDKQKFELSMTFGLADLNVEKFSPVENIDFLNYLNTYPDYLDFMTVKLGIKYKFSEKLTTDLNLILFDDLVPDNFDISSHYLLNDYFGIGAGTMLYKNYITNFETYHIDSNPDYYIMDGNVRQFKSFDLGFYISPSFRPVYNDRFKAEIKFDLGLSSFLKEETSFYMKRKNSNEKLLYDYKTTMAFHPYINPRVNLKLKAFKINGTSVGFMCNTNLFYSKKAMNYTRSIQVWTPDNATNQDINSPKHSYSRFEIDFGVYLNW